MYVNVNMIEVLLNMPLGVLAYLNAIEHTTYNVIFFQNVLQGFIFLLIDFYKCLFTFVILI